MNHRQASEGLSQLEQSEASLDRRKSTRLSANSTMEGLEETDPDIDDNLATLQMEENEKNAILASREGLLHANSSDIHNNSPRGMGTRPLGFEVIVQLKRHAKKERSQRRLLAGYDSLSVKSFAHSQRSEADETTSLVIEEEDESADGEPGKADETVWDFLHDLIFGKTVSIFLILMPFAFLAKKLDWGPLWVFWLNFFVMIPLASILGDFTEEVAAHTNQTLGGLINATFGNAVEVVVAIQALLANEIRVVQASMIGSIFSNLLLVLGCCFFFGGIKYKEQEFNSTAATANMSLLALSSVALVLPTPFAEYYDIQDAHVLQVSRVAAIFLISMYIQLLIFQLNTHADLFDDDGGGGDARISMAIALTGLCVTTLLITIFSEYLVSSIDGFCQGSGISRTFVGLIIIPIVGNAVEHITAVTVAMKDKMDLAMGIAVGSCTQISLFVVPLTVLIGWAFGKDMTLNFPHFELTLFVLSIFTVSICVSNPRSNWLEGSLLITTYLMIAVGFWHEVVVDF